MEFSDMRTATPAGDLVAAGESMSVQTTVLSNGMVVVMEELTHAPVVSFWAAYRVGSRNEPAGMTGVSHWLEHMLFKPTEQFPGAERDRLIAREGGLSNAFTWIDGTAYYTTIPSSRADLVYRIEADRLANTVLDEELFELERTVILAERHASENDPYWRLAEAVIGKSFDYHPYGHEIVGTEQDLRSITYRQADQYLRTHYVPNNGVLVAVGDFRPDELVPRLEELFGGIRTGGPRPAVPRGEETPPSGSRIEMEGPGGVGYLYAAYRAPAVAQEDFLPVMVLCSILGGPQSLTSSSGDSRSSRLYRGLVETGLAADVDCTVQATLDPYLIDFTVVLMTGVVHDDCERAFDAILDEIISIPVSEQELARAQKQLAARFVFENDRITHRAMSLMFASTVFGLDLYRLFIERVYAVTADDVLRVARKYLQPAGRVTGLFTPTDEE